MAKAFILLLIIINVAFTNPFLIDVKKKNKFLIDDYMNIQSQLKSIDISSLISNHYEEYSNLGEGDTRRFSCDSFYRRCSVGTNWTFFDLKQGRLPQKKLCKINNGGDCCIVCVSSYSRLYPELMLSNIFWLKKSGFNGFYLYFLGEYPNPTGKEIQYIGVPYAFKIFAMLEAEQLGFNKVIWLDAALKVLKDPTPLFEVLDKTGSFFTTANSLFPWWESQDQQKKIFPQTRYKLYELTRIDVANSKYYVPGGIIGFKMDHPLTKKFIDKYQEIVNEGYGFISHAPEEYVFSSILCQDEFKEWKPITHFKLLSNKKNKVIKSPSKMKIFPLRRLFKRILKKKTAKTILIEDHTKAELEGYFFYYREH